MAIRPIPSIRVWGGPNDGQFVEAKGSYFTVPVEPEIRNQYWLDRTFIVSRYDVYRRRQVIVPMDRRGLCHFAFEAWIREGDFEAERSILGPLRLFAAWTPGWWR